MDTVGSRPRRAKEAEGFEEAFSVHGPELFRLAARSLGDRWLAEEVVQETFARAWRSRKRFDRARASRRTWLFAIARNQIVDTARSRSARLSRGKEGFDDSSSAFAAEDPTDAALLSMHLDDALRRINENHRRVIFEVHYKDRPYKEVAAEMGIPSATLRSRMYYALKSLRCALEEMGHSFQT